MSSKPSRKKPSSPAAARRPAKRSPRRAPPEDPSSNGAVGAEPPELVQLLDPDGRLRSGVRLDLPPALLRELYRGMLWVRVLDARMLNLQRQGRIGFYGQSTGQEAAIIGSAAALGEGDWIVPALREMGVAVYRGYPLERLLTQLAGKDGEVSRGRQMPCHFSWREGRFVSMSSVIGTQIPHATGIARAAQIRGDRIAVLGYLGDGATSASDFHAGLNFAAVWKAPVVFFCQNNQWAISVPFHRQTASSSVAGKARAYGMPGQRVDGNDVLAVYTKTREALEAARAGRGPCLLEALTYRRMGHSSSDDPSRYRDPAELEDWERRDPLDRMRRFLESSDLLTREEHDAMEEEIHRHISEAVQRVEQYPSPPVESLVEDVFEHCTPQLERQRAALLEYLSGSSGNA